MSLRSIFSELYKEAAARATADAPGEAIKYLGQGAEITVRSQGRKRQVILSRRGVFVSETEVATFRRDGQIPPDAVQTAYASRDDRKHIVLTWEAPPTLFEGMPQTELPASLGKVSPARPAQQDAAGEGEDIT